MNTRQDMEQESMRYAVARQRAAWTFTGPRSTGARWQAEIRKTRPTVDYVSILRSRTLP